MSNTHSHQRPFETVYGPPPVDSYQKPQPTIYGPPPQKNRSCFMVSLIIGALIGGIITWLLGDCSNFINQPTVYGPPPIDSTQTVSPINNE